MTDLNMMTTTRRKLRAAHEAARVAPEAARLREEIEAPLLAVNATARAAAQAAEERLRDGMEQARVARLRMQETVDTLDRQLRQLRQLGQPDQPVPPPRICTRRSSILEALETATKEKAAKKRRAETDAANKRRAETDAALAERTRLLARVGVVCCQALAALLAIGWACHLCVCRLEPSNLQ